MTGIAWWTEDAPPPPPPAQFLRPNSGTGFTSINTVSPTDATWVAISSGTQNDYGFQNPVPPLPLGSTVTVRIRAWALGTATGGIRVYEGATLKTALANTGLLSTTPTTLTRTFSTSLISNYDNLVIGLYRVSGTGQFRYSWLEVELDD